jgi:hypothetical protein
MNISLLVLVFNEKCFIMHYLPLGGRLSAKKSDKEIAQYYQQKVKEGKKSILVMNAIKWKLLSRVYATVNRGIPYVNTNKFAA